MACNTPATGIHTIAGIGSSIPEIPKRIKRVKNMDGWHSRNQLVIVLSGAGGVVLNMQETRLKFRKNCTVLTIF